MSDAGSIPLTDVGPGVRDAARGEWRKLLSLRSTYWTLIVTLVGSVGITAVATGSVGHHSRAWYPGFDPTNQALAGLRLASRAIGVFGVLAMSGEYGTGTIRSTLAAVPRRRLLLAAKVLVIGGVSLLAGEVVAFSCFGVGQMILAGDGAPTAALSQPGVARAVLLSGAYLALLAMGALALGTLLRHTAGALAAYAGLTFLLPLVLQRLPGRPDRFTPLILLGNSVGSVVPHSDEVGAAAAFGLMALYAVVVLAVGSVVLARRDA